MFKRKQQTSESGAREYLTFSIENILYPTMSSYALQLAERRERRILIIEKVIILHYIILIEEMFMCGL